MVHRYAPENGDDVGAGIHRLENSEMLRWPMAKVRNNAITFEVALTIDSVICKSLRPYAFAFWRCKQALQAFIGGGNSPDCGMKQVSEDR